MLEKLFPDIYIKSIAEMPIEELKKRGIKALATVLLIIPVSSFPINP